MHFYCYCPIKTNILIVYSPTADMKYDQDLEILNNQLKYTKNFKNNQIKTLVDFNSKIGQGRREKLEDLYGLG